MSKITRREFLKKSAIGAAALYSGLNLPNLASGQIYSSQTPYENVLRDSIPPDLEQWLYEFPGRFPYDSQCFRFSESISIDRKRLGDGEFGIPDNEFITPVHGGKPLRTREKPDYVANISLAPKENLDIEVRFANSKENLKVKGRYESIGFHNAQGGEMINENLTVIKPGDFGKKIWYQVRYRNGKGPYREQIPKSFKNPTIPLKDKEMTVYIIADPHPWNWDVEDCEPKRVVYDKNLRKSRLSGGIVNDFLKTHFEDRYWIPEKGSEERDKLSNFYGLAGALYTINMDKDGPPDLILDLGDTTAIGVNQQKEWDNFGLPPDKETAVYALWERIRVLYSSISHISTKFTWGNHDGSEGYNPLRDWAIDAKQKYFPTPEGEKGKTYFSVDWADGDVLFACLDVLANVKEKPTKVEDWVIGEQLPWLEYLMRNSGARYKFNTQHHMAGGWPTGAAGKSSKSEIKYARGSDCTYEDYDKYRYEGVNPDKVTQVAITEIMKKFGGIATIYGHDHISKAQKKGNKFWAIVCGNTTSSAMRNIWENSPYFQQDYGYGFTPLEPDFWGPPVLGKLKISKDGVKFQFVCSANPFHGSTNTSPYAFDKKIGEVLRAHQLSD